MGLDAVLLSRIQFALTIGFHYLFPPLTIGLAALMVFMEAMFHRTGDRLYESMARFWTKIFAVNFALGVATGIVMEFQFGTNWSAYSRFVGDIFGSPLAAEGLFAFFLESTFLGILVFGWDRVSPRMHLVSTILVATGSILSAFWIIVANSWQQTPAGFRIVGEGAMRRAEITDFWAAVFNPSTMTRYVHVILGAFILGAFFVAGVAAWYLLKGRHVAFAKRSMTLALVLAAVSSTAQLASGHHQANNVAEHQPIKMAAYEGHYRSLRGGAPLYLFGFPDDDAMKVRMGIGIPGMLSFLIHNDWKEPVPALDQFPREDWPPVGLTFQSYHVMIALGMYFIGLSLLGLVLLRRDLLFRTRPLLWVFVFSVAGPYLANQFGWTGAEVGRQPWIVYGLLRTSDGVSRSVSAGEVLASTLLFSLVYLGLFILWLWLLGRKLKHGPEPLETSTAVPAGTRSQEA
ncbi:MAG: cytochrome ubiquinol oxidase subunit I [Candidatus Eisenbacteria bacterium]|nr:cytochrome ubiquinol oxidase subunit I [Candidatus Eisenbacteria bacterium]